jgi:6-phosphogluconolactonase/glucosamine-6-phosphate isomerase/deaminase
MDIKQIDDLSIAVDHIAEQITKYSIKSQITLLLPGGSAAKLGIQVLQSLSPVVLLKLTVTLTDERFGPVGHDDSNWNLLASLGLPSEVKQLPVLCGKELIQTANTWSKDLEYLAENSVVIAIFGIGTDYHIAGLKPGYDFKTGDSSVSYTAKDFERISITPRYFKKITLSIIFAEGIQKLDAIEHLKLSNSIITEPMQLVKDSSSVLVYHYL